MSDSDYEPPSKAAKAGGTTEDIHDEDLYEKYRRSGKSFIEFSKSEEFMNAQPAKLKCFLESDDLMADTEEDIYFALERWYKSDKKKRLDGYLEALQSIRYALLSHDAFVPVSNAISSACTKTRTKKLLHDISMYWKGYEKTRVALKMNRPKPRTSYAEVKNYLYVLGQPRDGLQFLQCYDFGSKTWTVIEKSVPIARSDAGVAAFEGRVWVAGGISADKEKQILDSVYSYDPVAQTWNKETNMNEKRYGLGLAALDGKLHAVGGANEKTALNTMEVYQASVWTAGPSMNEKRYDVAVVSAYGKLIAAAGTESPTRSSYYKKTWECFESGRWRKCLPNMRWVRKGCILVETRGIVYYVGGDKILGDQGHGSCSLTEFHLSTNTFYNVRNVFAPIRIRFASAALGGFIYFVGGVDLRSNDLKSFQRYDPAFGTTEYLIDPPNAPGDNAKAVIIERRILPEDRPGPSQL